MIHAAEERSGAVYERRVWKNASDSQYMKVGLEFEGGRPGFRLNDVSFKLMIVSALRGLHGEIGAALPVDVLKFEEQSLTAILRIQVGERAELTRVFTQSDVFAFAELTGDTNPLHLSTHYAKAHRFEKPVVHGTLVCGLISAVLGTKMPGCILLSQELRFLAPLYADEEVSAIADIIKIKRSIAWITVSCIVNKSKKIILKGDVRIMLPED